MLLVSDGSSLSCSGGGGIFVVGVEDVATAVGVAAVSPLPLPLPREQQCGLAVPRIRGCTVTTTVCQQRLAMWVEAIVRNFGPLEAADASVCVCVCVCAFDGGAQCC